MGRLILPSGSRIYLDTAPIIYSVEKHPKYWSLLQDLWVAAERLEIEIFTSELTLLEVLVLPSREKDEVMIRNYQDLLLGTDLNLVPISTSILKEAVNFRANLNLKTPDAIHASTATLA